MLGLVKAINFATSESNLSMNDMKHKWSGAQESSHTLQKLNCIWEDEGEGDMIKCMVVM